MLRVHNSILEIVSALPHHNSPPCGVHHNTTIPIHHHNHTLMACPTPRNIMNVMYCQHTVCLCLCGLGWLCLSEHMMYVCVCTRMFIDARCSVLYNNPGVICCRMIVFAGPWCFHSEFMVLTVWACTRDNNAACIPQGANYDLNDDYLFIHSFVCCAKSQLVVRWWHPMYLMFIVADPCAFPKLAHIALSQKWH